MQMPKKMWKDLKKIRKQFVENSTYLCQEATDIFSKVLEGIKFSYTDIYFAKNFQFNKKIIMQPLKKHFAEYNLAA